MKAGTLRQYVTINSQSTTRDAYNQPVQAWNPLCLCWASVSAITSKELYSIGGFTSQATHKVTIRYPVVSVVHGMQVTYEGHILIVQGISDPDGLKRELDLYCLDVT